MQGLQKLGHAKKSKALMEVHRMLQKACKKFDAMSQIFWGDIPEAQDEAEQLKGFA